MSAPTDSLLLFHTLRLAASIDGDFAPEEGAIVRNLLATLPDFADVDLDAHAQASSDLAREYGGLIASAEALVKLSSPLMKARAYLLAVEVVCVSEGLNAVERDLLTMLRQMLEVERLTAEHIHEVVGLKYGQKF